MLAYAVRRVLLLVPVLLGILLVVTASLEFVPGDPAALMLGQFATPQAVQDLRHTLHLDQPFLVRYWHYVLGALHGDLGRSFTMKREVADEILATLPATAKLAGLSLVFVLFVSIPAGVIAAMRPNSITDSAIRIGSLMGLSMPVFWTAILLIILFSLKLRVLPVGGYGGIRHLVLPAVTLAAPSVGMVTRMVRSSILEVYGEDYVNTARAKGLPERTVVYKHVLRNAFIPVITVLGAQLGQMLGGAVLTETVFSWPGLGQLTVLAIFRRDYVLIQGVVLVLATTYVVVNLLVDLTYAVVNPRISYT